ncbi:hypothetical protein BDU57DRAFT_131784 [Ampelomyces quisqualis]|uniref:Uncharacterized protein n=1 Tax=Ampelomyces quisqualis TaxID=50730 RepID=A0A6A5QWD4_AMPQU|nr:hypothetical protein BDU57DRAFT_131784 [Ampelomyces quisqualis]
MAAHEEVPWTTSRCNRLLRPISSKLTKLRAELEKPRSASGDTRIPSTAFATKCPPHKTTNFTRPAQKPRGFDRARDPDWRPEGKSSRGGKKTYGGRGVKKIAGRQRGSLPVSRDSKPGEIAFTPLVARISSQIQSSPHAQNSPLKKYGKNRGPLQVNIDWTRLPDDLRKLVQGVSEAYANLLQATAERNERSWNGTRSLLAACLRRLPAYIELEEHFAKLDRDEDEEEERDISGEVYGHLEDEFEQRPGQGWRFFKQVVRAHATSLLCDAIADELIGLDSMSMLVTHCIRVSAWDEAERLLLAYLPLLQPLSMPINIKSDLFDASRSLYLCAVKSFVDQTGRRRVLFDLLEHMIAYELLPLEWLATECMRSVWDRLVKSVSNNDHRTIANAFRFFETVTMAGMGLPDQRLLADETTGMRRFVPSSREELRQALNTTYSSLLTVMCSIALVHNGRDDDMGKSVARRVRWMIDAVVIATLSRNDIRSEFKLLEAHIDDGQTFLQRGISTIFASLALQLDNCPVEQANLSLEPRDLNRGLNWLATQYSSNGMNTAAILSSLPGLVSSIARGTGRIWKDDGFDQLKRLVKSLMSLSGHCLPHRLWTTKRLALESALEFAQDTRMTEHFSYAREIERKMRTQGQLVIAPSPQKNDSPSTSGGFRWEEGIGEWVACTPFAKQGVKRIARKPVPTLGLLPTPVQSEDEDVSPGDDYNEKSVWETTAFDHVDEDAVPQSSPIKRALHNSLSLLGKRQRASSPMVLVLKRTKMTPPDTPVQYYPELTGQDAGGDGLRRSRRSRTEIKPLASGLRTHRSRTSLASGLRSQQRKIYVEPIGLDVESSGETNSESGSKGDSVASLGVAAGLQSSQENARRRRGRPRRAPPQLDGSHDDADERDDLGITPARPKIKRRTSSRLAGQKGKQWWRVTGRVVNDSDGEGSADELSFH